MVCIKHHLFPIQTHIYILSGDRLKVIGDSELDTDALQAVPQDHTYGIKIACKLMLMDRIDEHPDVAVTWFQPDGKKDGGRYVTTTGRLKRIDEVERVLVMEDKTTVPLDDIISIDECRSPDFTSDL